MFSGSYSTYTLRFEAWNLLHNLLTALNPDGITGGQEPNKNKMRVNIGLTGIWLPKAQDGCEMLFMFARFSSTCTALKLQVMKLKCAFSLV